MKTLLPVLSLSFGLISGAVGGDAVSLNAHPRPEHREPALQPIDLAAVLRLAGANNLDVQIARQSLAEAEANRQIALEQFFPYLSPALSYSRHEGKIQTVQGPLIDVNSELYRAGVGATAQIALGDAIFNNLASRQLVKAARYASGAQKQESIFQAVEAYFDVVAGKAENGVAIDSVRITEDYAGEVKHAADAGLALKADVYRATTEAKRNQL